MEFAALYLLFGLVGIVLLCMIGLLIMGGILLDRTKSAPDVNTRLEVIETYIAQLMSELLGSVAIEDVPGQFRSLDGKLIAGSLEEFMEKMSQQDPEVDQHEEDKLKDFFTDATKDRAEDGTVLGEWTADELEDLEDEEDDIDDDSDDLEEPDEPWKKK